MSSPAGPALTRRTTEQGGIGTGNGYFFFGFFVSGTLGLFITCLSIFEPARVSLKSRGNRLGFANRRGTPPGDAGRGRPCFDDEPKQYPPRLLWRRRSACRESS